MKRKQFELFQTQYVPPVPEEEEDDSEGIH